MQIDELDEHELNYEVWSWAGQRWDWT